MGEEKNELADNDKYRILKEVVQNNEVIGIFGKRGSGKSAAGYAILEYYNTKENAHVVGLGKEHWHLLPDTIVPLPLDFQTLNDLPWHSTIFIDEAAQYFYARDSHKTLNKFISKLETDARKKDQLLVFATHTFRKLDIGVILDMDALMFKQPSMLHARFERKEILEMVKSAKREFDRLPKSENRAKYAYLISDDYEGMIEVPLPSFWCDELSNAVAPEVGEYEAPSDVFGSKVLNIQYEIDRIDMTRGRLKEKRVNEIEKIIEEVTVAKKLPEVTGTAAERIREMIAQGMQIIPNYYASRGVSIIEVVCPKELESEVESTIYKYKVDPKAPDVMAQEPSFAETRPDFAEGMVAFQFYLDDPRNLLSSGYSIKNMMNELKKKPILITIATTIKDKIMV